VEPECWFRIPKGAMIYLAGYIEECLTKTQVLCFVQGSEFDDRDYLPPSINPFRLGIRVILGQSVDPA